MSRAHRPTPLRGPGSPRGARSPRGRRGLVVGVVGATALAGVALVAPSAEAGASSGGGHYTKKTATSRGYGGAVSSVDPEASKVGLGVLKRGGNAVDAAVATAAALGVTEPYSSGLGGGGYFVYYNAKTGKVRTLDGRETAPARMRHDAFVDPKTGKTYPFTPDLVTSGVSTGVPGSPATWDKALRRWGTYHLRQALSPAAALARRGFVVDKTFREQTLDNKVRFKAYSTTPKLYLPGGDAPKVGSVFRNRDLARTYDQLSRHGMRWFYTGPIAREISDVVRHPRKSRTTKLPVPAGSMRPTDLAGYSVLDRLPTRVGYRGYDVFGMAPSSSGGITVGEMLNIMENYDLRGMSAGAALHHYLEASALAYADRAAYLGDPAYVDVPQRALLSDRYAKERACQISETTAFTLPVEEGDTDDFDGVCPTAGSSSAGRTAPDTENVETTNMTVADKWGNVVEYTLTIEQTGGSGQLVPGRGFLLNNELTDFSTEYVKTDPNRIQPGKRPRSSISPTIILKDDKPVYALGSPGGSTIITTVAQMIFNRIDRGMTLPRAIADPRAQQPNTAAVNAEPGFIDKYGAALAPYGHQLKPTGDKFTSKAEIGAATALEFGPGRLITAVSEPTRRGGGSALVVRRR